MTVDVPGLPIAGLAVQTDEASRNHTSLVYDHANVQTEPGLAGNRLL
jgi:hypothetical protein